MGSCVSARRRAAIHPLIPQGDENVAVVEQQTSVEENATGLPRRKSLYYKVDPTVPATFYPKVVGISREEEQCRLTRSKLAVKETERQLRSRGEEVQKNWRQIGVIGEIESHALGVPAVQATSVRELAMSLTSPQAKYVKSLSASDTFHMIMAKLYAIFFWVANNIHFSEGMWRTFLSNPEDLKSKTESQAVLKRRKCIAIGHANLFQSVAAAAGLTAHVVTGNLKLCRSLTSQDPMQEFEPSRLNLHWWNVVLIDGVWFPVDCACGGGMIAPHLQFHPKFRPHFFAVRPDHLILTHWPTEPEWQLLQERISLDGIRPLISPPLTSFHLGIEPLTWAEVIHIEPGSGTTTIKISFRAPPNLRLSANLSRNDSSCHGESSSQERDQCSLQTTYIERKELEEVDVFAAVPDTGVYSLGIYAHHNTDSNMCISYVVNCTSKTITSTGFPTVHERPSAAFQFNLLYWNTPQAADVCENHQGKMDIVFQCLPSVQFHHCLIPGCVDGQQVNLDLDARYYCTTITHDPINRSLHKLSAIFPTRGWWTVYLCAAKTSSDVEVSGYTVLMSHPVQVKKELRRGSYPHIESSHIRCDYSEPLLCSGTDILVVPFYSTKHLHLYSCLCYDNLDAKPERHFTLTESLEGVTPLNENKYVLKVIFPKSGKWYVRVFARDKTQPSDADYLSLFNMFIEVDGCMENAAFPIVNQEIIDKCNIQFPSNWLTIIKDEGENFSFSFQAPKNVKIDLFIEPAADVEENGESSNESIFYKCCTFLHVDKVDGDCRAYKVNAVFPRKGEWNVVIRASETFLSTPELAIQIPATIVNTPESRVFPRIHPAIYEFGIKFCEENPLYERSTDSPVFSFDFLSPKYIHFGWSLQNIQTQSIAKFSTNVFLECKDNEEHEDVNQKLQVVFPKPGVWLVQVSAKTVLTGIVPDCTLSLSLHYQPVFDLVVHASNASLRHMAFPTLYESFYSKFGLRIKSTDLPLPARVNELPAMFTVKFYSPPDVVFWHQAREFSRLEDQQVTRMTSDPDTGLRQLCININQSGQWSIHLYAKYLNDSSNNWTAVLQHTVTARSGKRSSSTLSAQ